MEPRSYQFVALDSEITAIEIPIHNESVASSLSAFFVRGYTAKA
jgi:hypothetical protein